MTTSGDDVVRKAASNKPVEALGRLGLVCYGLVHLLLAYLTAQVALGDKEKASKSGALELIADNPGGELLMWVITIGLFAAALWQIGETIWRTTASSGARRILRRLGHGAEAVLFLMLGFASAKFAGDGSGSGGSGSSKKTSSLTAQAMELPLGPALVTAAGIAIIGGAAYMAYRGVKKKFVDNLDLTGTSPATRKLAIRLGQIGHLAIGITYALIGGLVVAAAVTYDPEEATGMDTALKSLADEPYGNVLLLAIAAGLVCYGAYNIGDARYRRAWG